MDIYYNGDLKVVQANELVRSRQEDLTILEAKLIRLAISQVLKDDVDLKTYTCNVKDLAKFLKINKDNIYRDIQSLSKNIMKKSIFIKDKKGNYKIFHWIDYIEYEEGVITFKLSDSLKPYLLGLQKLFTLYEYDNILSLPTNNAIRLYELLASYQRISFTKETLVETPLTKGLNKNEFRFTIDYLRDYFNCKDKYPHTSDFIKRVIEPSVRAIRKHTYMSVEYRIEKEKTSIKSIVFKLFAFLDEKGIEGYK